MTRPIRSKRNIALEERMLAAVAELLNRKVSFSPSMVVASEICSNGYRNPG